MSEVAQTAERGKLDMVFLADARRHPRIRRAAGRALPHSPTRRGSSRSRCCRRSSMVTQRIGLVATAVDHLQRAVPRRAPVRLARPHQRRPRRLERRHLGQPRRGAEFQPRHHMPTTTSATSAPRSSSRWSAGCGTAGRTTPSCATRRAASSSTRRRCTCSTTRASISRCAAR